MTDKQAMKLALFALDIVKIHYTQSRHINEAITALKERLAQPEQEPACPECKATVLYECVACSSNNYPPQRTEQEPTPEIKYKMIVIDDLHPQGIPVEQWVNPPQRTEPPQKKVWTFWDLSGGDITDAIKAKLKEKNT
jgi:hypothetical protein